MFWMYQRVFLGKLKNAKNEGLKDMSVREIVVLIPLVVFMFWLGVQPGLVLDRIELSIEKVLAPLELDQGAPHSLQLDETSTDSPVVMIRDTFRDTVLDTEGQ